MTEFSKKIDDTMNFHSNPFIGGPFASNPKKVMSNFNLLSKEDIFRPRVNFWIAGIKREKLKGETE